MVAWEADGLYRKICIPGQRAGVLMNGSVFSLPRLRGRAAGGAPQGEGRGGGIRA